MTASAVPETTRPRGRAVQGQRARALYNLAPSRCLRCDAPILAHPGEKLAEVRKRKFCGRSCAASHNNSLAVAPKKKAKPVWCTDCGVLLKNPSPSQKLCPDCKANRSNSLAHLTKGQCTPAAMRAHLKLALAYRPHVCRHCGYSRHVESVHIRPVDAFPETAPLHEINHPTNLAYLCPNCKWEFEHGLFALQPEHARRRAQA